MQAFWPPDNITLNPTNKKTDQHLADFQTGIGAAAHATLDMEQFISYTKAAFVDTVAYLQGSDEGVIAASEVLELLTTIHESLDSALCK